MHSHRPARLTLAVGQGILFDLLVDRDRSAADDAMAELTAMVRAKLEDSGHPAGTSASSPASERHAGRPDLRGPGRPHRPPRSSSGDGSTGTHTIPLYEAPKGVDLSRATCYASI